jgi:hypothetical protein
MHCMGLPWTAEEAEDKQYWCERCKPEMHKGLLSREVWKPLRSKEALTSNNFAEPTVTGTPNFNARSTVRRSSQPEMEPLRRPEQVDDDFTAMRQVARKKGGE